MRILANENIPRSVVKVLKEKGHDIATLYDLGKSGITDNEVMETAEKEDRAILTLNLDFGHIYYFAKKGVVNIMVVRTKIPTPENITKLLTKFFELKIEPKGLVIISEKKIRVLQ